jgi:hypothetical protein
VAAFYTVLVAAARFTVVAAQFVFTGLHVREVFLAATAFTAEDVNRLLELT